MSLLCYINRTNCNKSSSVQSLSRVRLCDPMDCSTTGFPVHHQLPERAQTHVHRVGDAASQPLSYPSPPACNLSQYQGLFQCQFFASGGRCNMKNTKIPSPHPSLNHPCSFEVNQLSFVGLCVQDQTWIFCFCFHLTCGHSMRSIKRFLFDSCVILRNMVKSYLEI